MRDEDKKMCRGLLPQDLQRRLPTARAQEVAGMLHSSGLLSRVEA